MESRQQGFVVVIASCTHRPLGSAPCYSYLDVWMRSPTTTIKPRLTASKMSKVTPITSHAHFKSTLSSTTYLIVDFYADWCGPCKQISPVFEQLAGSESKPGRLTFCKVDVDAQKEVAGVYGVSA